MFKLDLPEMPLSVWCEWVLLSFTLADLWWNWLHQYQCIWSSLGTILWMFC